MKMWTIFRIIPSSVITAVVLIFVLLRSPFLSAGICKKEVIEPIELCAQDLQMINRSPLPCELHTYYKAFYPPLVQNDHSTVLSKFNATQCLTEGLPEVYMGFKFSWSINQAVDDVTGLKVVIIINDMHPFYHELEINLTHQVNPSDITNFSTACVHFEGVHNGRNINIKALVLPENNPGFLFEQEIQMYFECNEIRVQHIHFCPAVPETRPVAKSFCNRTVSVTFTSAQPPGIGDRKTYMVEIRLSDGDKYLFTTRTLNATTVDAHAPSIYFEDVKPGTYTAMFAFLDEYGLACDNNYYRSDSTITVYDPLPVDLQLTGFCVQTIAVNLTTDVLLEQDVYDKGKVCLYEGESSNKSYSVCRTLYYSSIIEGGYHIEKFLQMKSGTYHAEFTFLDENDQTCGNYYYSSNVTVDETDCPTDDVDQSRPIVGVSLGVIGLLVVVAVAIIATWQARQIRNQHQQSLTSRDDSISGAVIIGERHVNDYNFSQSPSSTQMEVSPSVYEIQSFHDGRSCIIPV